METIIKVHPSELNVELLEKIRQFIGEKENIEVTISLKEYDKEYVDELNRSIESSENNRNVITFTLEDFMAYTPVFKPGK
jgi:ssRNA-specific RNase YbeY (16S rRNA maturation enzyme)